MTTEQATKLFETHDQFIKALKSAPLSPFLSNLDTVRTEQFPNGETLKRSTRDWALSIKTAGDDPGFAHCDVVNGGFDQKAYLLSLVSTRQWHLRHLPITSGVFDLSKNARLGLEKRLVHR